MTEKNLSEAEKEALAKKEQKNKIIAEEKKRKSIETFNIKEIGMWVALPWILLVIFGIYVGYDYYVNKNFNWGLVVPTGILGILVILASDIQDRWKLKLECKEEIFSQDPNYNWSGYTYTDQYIYTDSKSDYVIYKLAKIACYLVSFVLIAIIAILLFMWVGSISIAPTTVIIILLVIIILNQK